MHGFVKFYKYTNWLLLKYQVFWATFCLAMELKQICRLRSNFFTHELLNKMSNFWYEKFVQKYDHSHFHLKWFPTTITFGEIFLNNVVAYSFTYTMVLCKSWDTFKYNYSPYCGTLLSRLDALYTSCHLKSLVYHIDQRKNYTDYRTYNCSNYSCALIFLTRQLNMPDNYYYIVITINKKTRQFTVIKVTTV